MKKTHGILLIALALMLLLGAPGCASQPGQAPAPAIPTAPAGDAEPAQEAAGEALPALTLEELAAYNGKDGNPAYIAVEGVIYDVSNSSKWKKGEHNGYSAGQDLTDTIQSVSPHGTSVLSRLPIVGKLVD